MANKKSELTDNMECCFVCGSPYIQIHHCFFGAKRPISDKLGYILPLCMEHHTAGRNSPHKNREVDLTYKRLAQTHYELTRGSRNDFIQLFGKSYLE